MNEQTMTQEEIDRIRNEEKRFEELRKTKPISYDEYEKIIHQWMLIADTGILKLLAAIVIANRLKGHDAVWVMLIGPSGGGKSELLNMMLDVSDIYPVSLITPNTFLSGMYGDRDTSLLPKVNGKILMFKDWTNILSQQKDNKIQVLGQLREIYDGYMKKAFGNGKVVEWRGKVGVLAGVTPAVDLAQQMNSTLGERFINYRILMPDRKEAGRRSLHNGSKQEEMRNSMKKAFFAYLKGIDVPEEDPKLPPEVEEEIVTVANFATIARSGVIREFGTARRDVIYVPTPEMPTRSVQQLALLGTAFLILNNGEVTNHDMSIIYRLGLDSIPQTNYMVIKEMARGNEQTTSDIATALGYPTGPIRMYLENLALLGICKRVKASDSEQGGTADRWTMHEEFISIIRRYENIKLLEEKLLEKEIDLDTIFEEEQIPLV